MFRMILVFLVVWAIFFFGIKYFRAATKRENINFIKLSLYSSMCVVFASGVLSVIVYLF